MSSLRNEAILETIFEELMEELTLTETLPMYSEKEIESICYQRFEDLCQWLQQLFHSNLSQNVQDVVSGVNILCALIVNQSAKFITLVGQDYSVNNVKNV